MALRAGSHSAVSLSLADFFGYRDIYTRLIAGGFHRPSRAAAFGA